MTTERNEKARTARAMVNNLTRMGSIKRPEKCAICGKPNPDGKPIHAHHPDPINAPLMVVWACRRHHRHLHGWLIFLEDWMIDDYSSAKKRVYWCSDEGKRHWTYVGGYCLSRKKWWQAIHVGEAA